MPIRKIFRKRRVFRRKRFTRSRGALKKIIRRVVNKSMETKFVDSSTTAGAPVWTVTPVQLPLPIQGLSDQQRIGDKIMPTSLTVKGYVQNTAANSLTVLRCTIFRWHPNPGSFPPTSGNVLEGAYNASVNYVNAPFSHDLSKNYSVLLDKRITLVPSGGTNIKAFSWRIYGRKLRRIIQFIAGSGTNANNSLYMMWLASDNSGNTVLNSQHRMTYKDA